MSIFISTSYTAAHIVVTVGGYPIIDKNLPGHEHLITSDGFFELTALPKKVAVIGAGYLKTVMLTHYTCITLFLSLTLTHTHIHTLSISKPSKIKKTP